MDSIQSDNMGPASAPFVYQEKDFPSIMGSGNTRSRNYKEETVEGNLNTLSLSFEIFILYEFKAKCLPWTRLDWSDCLNLIR